jgi:SanA protein
MLERLRGAARSTAQRRWARRATLLAASLTATVWPFTAINARMQERARERTVDDPRAAPTRYVAIVLGAHTRGDVPSDVLEDRLQTALDLYRLGKVKRLLVSGDHGRDDYDEVRAMRNWLMARGVPSDDIFQDHAGFRTLDTMARAVAIFQVREAIVVTQAFHLARALFLAESAGIDAVGVVADRRRYAWEDHYARREYLARVRCWLDVHVLRTAPRFAGAPIPITGAASASHDAGTPP